MDLGLYLRVLWRFRLLVLAGVGLAVGLALLSFVRVSPDGFAHRQSEQWEASTTILVTGKDFPWGRSRLEEPVIDPETGRVLESSADPDWLTLVGFVFTQFAVSDEVRAIMAKDGPVNGSVIAAPLDPDSSIPVISIASIAATPEAAVALSRRGSEAFGQFLEERQDAADIPASERVQLQVLTEAQGATLLQGRKLTRPIVVFIAVMTAVLGLAFVLENLRPRIRPLPAAEEEHRIVRESGRRSA